MDTIRPLPARQPLLPGESLISLIRRTADAMGYNNVARMRSLLKETGELPTHFNHMMPGPAWVRLETWLRQSTPSIVTATVHHYAQHLMLVAQTDPAAEWCDSKTILKYFQSGHPPVCPLCLLEDEQAYERLAWSLRAVPVCLRHECYLIAGCPKCDRSLRPERRCVTRCRCGFDMRTLDTVNLSKPAAQIFEQIAKWFEGKALSLKAVRACAALWWLERLVSATRKAADWTKQVFEAFAVPQLAPADTASWLAAAEILAGWPQRLFAFLEAFQQITKHRTTATGITRSFGLLLREAKHLEDLGYSLPADTLRQYLTQRYTAGHLTAKVCLFSAPAHQRLLQERPWVSLAEAEAMLHLRNSAALVERGILEGTIRSARPGHRTVGLLTRASVDRLTRDLKTALSVVEVGELLGLGRSRVHELIKADILPRAVRTTGGWQVPRSSVDQVLGMIRQLPVIDKAGKHWLTIRQSTRRFGRTGLNLVRLVRVIHAGHVRARRTRCNATFRNLVVSVSDLTKACPDIQRMRDEDRGYPLNRLARTLFPDRPVKEVVLKKWIEMGLLRGSRGSCVWVVSSNEVRRFRAEYCLLSEAARILQVHGKTLLRWIAEGEVTPVYGPRTAAGGGFYLLRRDDIQRLLDFMRAHQRKWRAHKPAA